MANAKFIVGQTGGQIDFSVVPSTPSNPSAGYVTAYSDGSTFQVINSSGNPLIIGQTGAQGPAGATGAQGPAGATGAGASSPITVEQTNSLVSTAIGATALAGGSIAIGSTASARGLDTIVLGQNSSACGLGSIVIGKNSCQSLTDGQSVVIGNCACTNTGLDYGGHVVIGFCASGGYAGPNVAIGYRAVGNTDSVAILNTGVGGASVAIGQASNSAGQLSVAIGRSAYAGSDSVAVGACTTNQNGACSVAVGREAISSSANSILMGYAPRIFCGATGAIVLGNSSVGGTGACNSIVLGNTSCTSKPGEIAIGTNIATPATSAQCSVYIGNCITPGGNCVGASILGQTLIGFRVCQNAAPQNVGGAVLVGHCIFNNYQTGHSADGDSMFGICLTTACSRGNNAMVGRTLCGGSSANTIIGVNSGFTATDTLSHRGNVMIGNVNTFGNNVVQVNAIGVLNTTDSSVCNSTLIGSHSTTTTKLKSGQINSHYIGNENFGTANKINSVVLGDNNCIAQSCSGVIGQSSCAGHTGAYVIGNSINTEKQNTVHVDNLIAYGQAASKTNAVGSTGGTATLNWDNSNVQTLSLTSSISSLTKSNPIDGGVYTVFVTQGASGSYTVNWGSDVRWAGGTGPTLSTAVGATDAITLVYVAGITGYYGNANLNFA